MNTWSGGLTATSADNLGNGGTNAMSAQATVGDLSLDNNPANLLLDQAGPRADGVYTKLGVSYSRTQKFGGNWGGYLGLLGQLSDKNLDGSEKFSLGGPSGVRAYPVDEGSGDNGLLMNAELRWNVTSTVNLYGFYDLGGVVQHIQPWTNWQPVPGQPNAYTLQGAGTGVFWHPTDYLQIRAMVAFPIGTNPARDANGNDADGEHMRWRPWLQGSVAF